MEGRVLAAAAMCGAVLAGCVGEITAVGDPSPGGGGVGKGPVSSTKAFTCQSGLTPAAVPLRRLSRRQIDNTVGDLVGAVLPTERDAILGVVAPLVTAIPADTRKGPTRHWGGFTSVDQAVTQAHVDRGYDLAVALGKELTATAARLGGLAGDCATDTDPGNDDGCLDALLRTFGERVLRRAVTDEDVAFYRAVAGTAPFAQQDWADVIAQLFASPDFLYFVEHGESQAGSTATLIRVGSYELAARLSYHFWQTLPDDELLAAARSGALADDATYRAQVDRVFKDPRTRDAIRQFYAEWFARDDITQLNSLIGTPAFDALRGSMTPSASLRQDMFDEVATMGLYYSLDQPGRLEDIFTSRKSFATSPELAGLYGVPPWDGAGTPPDFVEPERQGLLTRAAMVATGTANTRPIMKGVFVRRALLCDNLPDPPPGVMAKAPEPAPDATAREVVEALTSAGNCRGCHESRINPLGFATENFDALGRPRSEELLIDKLSGQVLGTKPVNTVVTPHVDPNDDTTTAKDGVELQQVMLKSGGLHSCFARLYFRYTFGRAEDLEQDGCALAGMHGALEEGKPLGEVLQDVALTDAFRERNFGG